MQNKFLACVLTAAFVCACQRTQDAPSSTLRPEILSAPEPSSAVLRSPLAAIAPAYTNETLMQGLRSQAEELGIEHFGPAQRRPLTYEQGLERTRELAIEIAAERRALGRGKKKAVAIPSRTARVISIKDKEGSPIENLPKTSGTP